MIRVCRLEGNDWKHVGYYYTSRSASEAEKQQQALGFETLREEIEFDEERLEREQLGFTSCE